SLALRLSQGYPSLPCCHRKRAASRPTPSARGNTWLARLPARWPCPHTFPPAPSLSSLLRPSCKPIQRCIATLRRRPRPLFRTTAWLRFGRARRRVPVGSCRPDFARRPRLLVQPPCETIRALWLRSSQRHTGPSSKPSPACSRRKHSLVPLLDAAIALPLPDSFPRRSRCSRPTRGALPPTSN